jgi:predicted phage terminase large subunit-like protein
VRRARAAPRGYAKSTLETLVEPIHDVCYGIEKFIVIFSNTEVQSSQKLADIRTEILTNHRLAADYRISLASKRSAQSSYVLVCGEHRCLLQGYGANTEVRGIRFGSDRPSKIILDDAEHSEEVLNEAIRTKYEDWYNQVVSKLGDTQTNIKIVGTILHPESLLANKIRNPAFDGKIYKAVINWSPRQDLWNTWTKIYTNLDDPDRRAKADAFYAENESAMLDGTKVLWPEKESYLYLMKELIETGKRAFYKEKQNEPIGGVTALFENIAYYQERSDGFLIEATDKLIPWSQLKDREGRWLGSFGALDPATGQTKAKAGKLGDYNCILTGMAQPIPGREHKLRLFVHHDWTQREGPSRTFSQVFDQDEIFDYSKFAVETNLYRDLMLPNLEAERKRQMEKNKRDLRVPFYDVEAVENKEKRIYTLEPKVTHSWILFNRALSPTFMRQVEAFPFGDHDDGPDALEMLWGLVNGRYKPSPLSLNQGGR